MPDVTSLSDYMLAMEGSASFNTNPLTGNVNGVVDPDQMTPDLHPSANATRKCELCAESFMFDPDNENNLVILGRSFSSGYLTNTYHYVCSTCTWNCPDCDDITPRTGNGFAVIGYSRYVNGKCDVCAESYYSCERCDDILHVDDAWEVSGSAYYCEVCRDRISTWCNECEHYEYDDSLCSPHDDNIRNYGYKPSPVFHGTDTDNEYLRFGIELEVEAKNADLSEGAELMVNEWDDFVYLKEDGSLNFGFEIVTHPASLKYYQDVVNWRTIDKLRDMGFRSWNTGTCGLHVHIDRRAFKDRTHIMAFSMLLNNNIGLSSYIAGRNSDYGKIGELCKRENIATLKYSRRGNTGGERYLAINMQNSSTIEVRMFKGSLKVERVLSGIEFCHALVQYSRDIRSGMHARDMLRPEEFTTWIRKQGKYPNLVQFLPSFQVTGNNDNNEMEA